MPELCIDRRWRGVWRASRVLALGALGLLLAGSVPAAVASGGEQPPGSGALDLDVRPRAAEVWINGQYLGVADAYDGFPRYLWVDPGDYRLVFYLPGYRTVAREFSVDSGKVTRVRTRLEKGETVPADTLFEKPTARADARLQADRERAQWNDEPPDSEAASWFGPGEASLDLRSDPARMFLLVRPGDAAIYLDSRFLGTGDDLASLHAGLLIDTGEHVLEVVRPGFETHSLKFEVAAGEDERLEIELKKGGGGE